MFDKEALVDRLRGILDALERIPARLKSIRAPGDFLDDEAGREHLDSVCMVLIAVGEAIRQLDAKTNGEFLHGYPEIPWKDVIGVRNVIAHGYFDVDVEQVFNICFEDIPVLTETIRTMLRNVQNGAA